MDDTNSNQQQNTPATDSLPKSTVISPSSSEPVVVSSPVSDLSGENSLPPPPPPPEYISPTPPQSSSHKIIIIIGIVLTVLASIGIAGAAIATFLSKTKNATENQVVKQNIIPTITSTQNTAVDNTIVRDEMVKEIVLTAEDPTRPGVPVEKKTEFTKKTETIYATVVLNKPVVGSKISYVRYFNSKYIDHGTIIISKPDSKYVHFLFSLANQKVFHPVGSYELRIYVDGQVVKMISYAVRN